MNELIGIYYSPWTEKARWALEIAGKPYHYSDHTLLLGMPLLRLKIWNFTQSVTVPVLIDGTEAIQDSAQIARRVAPQLFPEGRSVEIERHIDLSERALDASRALLIERIRQSADAQAILQPRWVPTPLRPALVSVVGLALRYLEEEFEIRRRKTEEHRQVLRSSLDEMRSMVRPSSLTGSEITFGDIALATTLQFIEPMEDRWYPRGYPLSPKLRPVFRDHELAQEYGDLVKWRDWMYSQYRERRPAI